MKFKDYIIEAKRMILKANIKKKISKELHNLTTPKNKTVFFKKIPLQDIFDILKKYGIIVLQEDRREWSGLLLGVTGSVYFDVAPIASKDDNDAYIPFSNAILALQWYKLSSGKYEITTYMG